MRRLVLIAALVLVMAVGYRSYLNEETGTGDLTLPQPGPNVGAPAPEFTATTADGEKFTLSDDGAYVLSFRSTLNRASGKAGPSFAEIARDFKGSKVSFATVYLGSMPRTDNVPYTMLQDSSGELASLYNVKRVPRLFVIQDGEIELVLNGYYQTNEGDIRDELTKVVDQQAAGAAKAPAKASSQPRN